MRYLVTGGAGFIGSHLVEHLMKENNEVVVYDNLSNGKLGFLEPYMENDNLIFINEDLFEREKLIYAMQGVEAVFHLAANSDIQYGTKYSDYDLQQGVLGTYEVLNAMEKCGVKKIVFSSSSAVFGKSFEEKTPENYQNTLPISLYGASKNSAESFISAYCHCYDFQAWILRFANIIGPRQTHGILFDLIHKLNKDVSSLEVFGDGSQNKDYLYVKDCVSGILFFYKTLKSKVNIINLGTGKTISVDKIVHILLEEAGLDPSIIHYTGGKHGWKGDVNTMRLNNAKAVSLGWTPECGEPEEIVRKTVKILLDNMGEF